MAQNDKKGERFGEEPKIRPRQSSKSERSEDEGTEERKTRRLLEKKADEQWLSKLKPLGEEDSAKDPEVAESAKSAESGSKSIEPEDSEVEGEAPKNSEVLESPAGPEFDSDAGIDPDSERSRKRRRRSYKKPSSHFSPKFLLSWLKTKAFLLVCVVFGAVAFGAVFWKIGESFGYQAGREISRREHEIKESQRVFKLSPEANKELDEALLRLRDANSSSSEDISRMVRTYPDVPSLNYAAALSSIQSGDLENATKYAEASIAKGEKISDSYVILSILESQKAAENPSQQFGDPRLRVKMILEKAIAADPMNSGARMELGSLLRYMGDEPGAVRELRAAKARLHPVDSHLSVDVTVALIEVENLPLDALTPSDPDSQDLRVLFPAAYIAMRHENFPLGISLLKRCRDMMSPDSFNYLVNDRAFRRFSYLPEMKELQGQ